MRTDEGSGAAAGPTAPRHLGQALDAWSRPRRTGGVVVHTDLLAFPAS
ncbi:hypothetical protein WMF30_18400 [Sorangium sp. So ce134]